MAQAVAEKGSGISLAELVATLSFATDLGRGLPMEHSIRRARLALRLADRVGANKDLIMLRRLGAGESGLARVRRIAQFPLRGWADVNTWLDTHSALQAQFATRMGLPASVGEALRQSYERWDGKGVPNGVKGEKVPLAARIVSLADVAEVYNHRGGVEAARGVAIERSGGEFDPDLAETLCEHAPELLEASTGRRAGAR